MNPYVNENIHNATRYSNNVSLMVQYLNGLVAFAENDMMINGLDTKYICGFMEPILDSIQSKNHHYSNLVHYENFRRKNKNNAHNNVGYLSPLLALYYVSQEPDFRTWYVPHETSIYANNTESYINLMAAELNMTF